MFNDRRLIKDKRIQKKMSEKQLADKVGIVQPFCMRLSPAEKRHPWTSFSSSAKCWKSSYSGTNMRNTETNPCRTILLIDNGSSL